MVCLVWTVWRSQAVEPWVAIWYRMYYNGAGPLYMLAGRSCDNGAVYLWSSGSYKCSYWEIHLHPASWRGKMVSPSSCLVQCSLDRQLDNTGRQLWLHFVCRRLHMIGNCNGTVCCPSTKSKWKYQTELHVIVNVIRECWIVCDNLQIEIVRFEVKNEVFDN